MRSGPEGPVRASWLVLAWALLASCTDPARAAEAARARLARGEVRVSLSSMPNTLDWSRSSGAAAANYPLFLATMRGLTQIAPDDSVQPGIAARWEACPPDAVPCVYVFHLRRDLRWSDGAPVVAEDFVHGWRRAAGSHGQNREGFSSIAGHRAAEREPDGRSLAVEALDAHTLRVTLETPSSSFLARLANVYELFPVPSHALVGLDEEQTRRYFETPTGASPAVLGPFRVESWDRSGERIRLVRNERSAFAPRLAANERRVEALVLVSGSVPSMLYEQGETDFYSLGAPEARVRRRDAAPDLVSRPLLSTFYVVLNPAALPDRDLRAALARALDPGPIVARVVPDARVARTLVPPTIAGSDPDRVALAPLDDEARARLGSIGRPLRLLYDGSPGVVPQASIARRIRGRLATLGVAVVLDEQWGDAYTRRRDAGVFDLALRRTGADYAHPNTFLSSWHGEGTGAAMWRDLAGGEPFARFEAAVRRADAIADPAETRDYALAERILLDEVVLLHPLYHPDRVYRRRPGVEGLEVDPFNFITFANLRVAASEGP